MMKLSTTVFAVITASLISTGSVLADDVGKDWLYGSENIHSDFTQMPATASGPRTHNKSGGVTAIPDYLEGLNSNQ